MARAALRLVSAGEKREDLRIPIASALVELYGGDHPTDELADLVEAFLRLDEMVPAARPETPSVR